MGFTGISTGSLLLILLVVLLLFGRQRMSTIGEDLAKAIKGFKKVMDEDNDKS